MGGSGRQQRRDVQGTVYLLHFSAPLRHARHYLGWSENLLERLALHASGNGAKILAAAKREGIAWTLARTWEGTRATERKLKNRHGHGPALCPVCKIEKEGKPHG